MSANMPAPGASIDGIGTDLSAVTARLAEARNRVAAGRSIDLDGLLDAIDATMTRLSAQPAAARKALEPALLSLLHECDALIEDLGRAKAEIAGSLRDSSRVRRAADAYGRRGSR
ncbi:MAG: hypothetical protein KDE35_12485 [Geminicoccaceae bacterium]|nr:hypothetical protein [Geminicoccaceae bacterium]